MKTKALKELKTIKPFRATEEGKIQPLHQSKSSNQKLISYSSRRETRRSLGKPSYKS
jgi:hypothetical protein